MSVGVGLGLNAQRSSSALAATVITTEGALAIQTEASVNISTESGT